MVTWGIWNESAAGWMHDPLRAPVNMSPAVYSSPAEAERHADRDWRKLNPEIRFIVRPFTNERGERFVVHERNGDVDHRSHFARGYSEGERDSASGTARALVTAEGDEPAIVKGDDSAYYHGYKAAVEGVVSDEDSAWAAYVAKHALQHTENAAWSDSERLAMFKSWFNSQGHWIYPSMEKAMQTWQQHGIEGLPPAPGLKPNATKWDRQRDELKRSAKQWMRSSLENDIHGDFVDSANVVNTTKLVEEYCLAHDYPDWLDDSNHPVWDWAMEVAEEGGYNRNPLHLKLDGKFEFGLGTADDKAMRANAARRSRAKQPAATARHESTGQAEVLSAVYRGIEALPLHIGVSVSPGAADVRFPGIKDHKAREARVRVHSALTALGSGLDGAVTVQVPTEAEGAAGHSGLDLPVALGILVAQGVVPAAALRGVMVLGELAFDGSVRPVRGAAVIAAAADAAGAKLLIVPDDNETEARFAGRVPVMSFRSLAEVVQFMQHPKVPREPPVAFAPCPVRFDGVDPGLPPEALDAVLDGKNLLLVGPPGAGKTMAARFIHSSLPALSEGEARELTLIYSAAGLLDANRGYVCSRPFRAPHHSVSEAGLLGGGDAVRPGEVSLAHNGILFLDEATEFRAAALQAVEQADRNRRVCIARSGVTTCMPAMPTVIGAANPCACGYRGTSRECRCSAQSLKRHEDLLLRFQEQFEAVRVDLEPMTSERLLARARGTSMRANAKGDVIYDGNLLTWVSVGEDKAGDPRGLNMVPTAEGRAQAQEMLEERQSPHFRGSPLSQEFDFLEDALGNGWNNVPPEDIGALTDATIVSQDGFIGDRGGWFSHPDVARPVVYAHMNYAVEDPIEMWAEGKPVFWQADVLELTPEGREAARKEWASGQGEDYEPNARKNVSEVIEAFRAGRRHSEKTCSTDGSRVYSYSMLIAARVDAKGEPTKGHGRVLVLSTDESPTVTTSGQINAVQSGFPEAEIVSSFPRGAVYSPNARKGNFKTPAGLTPAEAFFFEHAGYSFKEGASAAERKRSRVEQAKAAAAAEAEAEERGWTVEWEYDEQPDVSWMDEEAMEDFREGRTEMLSALLKDENGEVLQSLGGVHLNARGSRDPYARVVESELIMEALHAEESAGRAMALNPSRRQARRNWRMMLDLPGVTRRLGAGTVADVLATPDPAATASREASGAWNANDSKLFEAFQSLARMIEDGEMDDLIAETR